jgi:transposase
VAQACSAELITRRRYDKAIERLFAWLSRYRRLNIVYDRAADLFAGHIWIAMISIISRRIVAQTQPQQGV